MNNKWLENYTIINIAIVLLFDYLNKKWDGRHSKVLRIIFLIYLTVSLIIINI